MGRENETERPLVHGRRGCIKIVGRRLNAEEIIRHSDRVFISGSWCIPVRIGQAAGVVEYYVRPVVKP
jgi:hypothetical protein